MLPRALKKSLVAVAILLAPFIAYGAFNAWEIHRLEGFCGSLRPGTPIDRVATIAADHGIDPNRIIDARTFPEAARDQGMLVLPGELWVE